MIQYATALYLTAEACTSILGCVLIQPGNGYASRTPTQHPNWCVMNNGMVPSGAMLSLQTPIKPQLLMGPGVKPCGLPHARKDPAPTS